ncbi:MAG: hypothetical protein QXO69_01680 [archaeon]
MAGLPNKKKNAGIQKKRINASWKPLGVSKAAQMSEAARLLKKALVLAKQGRTKEAQSALEKAEKIKKSI